MVRSRIKEPRVFVGRLFLSVWVEMVGGETTAHFRVYSVDEKHNNVMRIPPTRILFIEMIGIDGVSVRSKKHNATMNLGTRGRKKGLKRTGISPFNPKFKKYILPIFRRQMHKWCSENW